MNITVETHSHTLASGHAYSTMKDMIQSAKEKGLEAIAFTEHAPLMPGTCGNYYFQNFRVIPREQDGMKIIMGTELNILNESGEVDFANDFLKTMDIVIASVHTPCYVGEYSKDAITEAYMNTMKNPCIDIIGYPDDSRFPIHYEVLVKAAKESRTLLEVNNSSLSPVSFRQNGAENITEMLELCKKYQVPVTLGSDAHIEFDVGNCTYSKPLLESCDFPEQLVANTSLEKLQTFLRKG